jgi:hypothetical protein
MTNDIDTLMARVDEINRKDPPYADDDITTIIAYHRRNRALKAAGIKPEKPKIDLTALLGNIAPKPTGPSPFKGRKL